MYKAVVTDLDGTLLKSDSSISPRTAAALQALQQRGVPVIACTGRSISEAMDVVGGYPLHPIMVLLTGALVMDVQTGCILRRSSIAPDLAGEILDLLRQDSDTFFYLYNGEHLHAFPEMRQRMQHCGMNAKDVACTERWMVCDAQLADRVRRGALICEKIFAIVPDPGRRAAIGRAVAGRAECIRAGEDRLEILAVGNNKRTGLLAALQALNLQSEHILAFGDSENDIPLAQTCATFVAMENADPALRSYAARQTASNDADGVAMVMEELFQLQPPREEKTLWI